MKTIKLKSNHEIPAIGLGTWKSEKGAVGNAVLEALKCGYRHLDCAAVYGNEKEIGEALQQAFTDNIVKREELWVTSKLWNNAHEKDRVLPALNQTLSDLQLKYLDLYLIHWPVAFKPEVGFPQSGDDFLSPAAAPIAETWKMMESAVDKDLCKTIGVSNFSIQKLQKLLENASKSPEMNQVEMHPLLPQTELLEFCKTHEIVMTGYSPLGSGDRQASMKKEGEPNLMKNPLIAKLAEKHNCSPAQVLIAWHIHRDTAVIPKSTNPGRIKENLESADILLDEKDMEAIAAIDQKYRYVDGKFFEMEDSPYSNIFDL